MQPSALSTLFQRHAEIDESRVSIVIVCYNQARYLDQAIRSALAQSHRMLEIFVVDDGSTDDTAVIAAAYPRVRYIHQSNRGLAAARNTGLAHCSGEYVAFLDADDRLLPAAIRSGLECFADFPQSAF